MFGRLSVFRYSILPAALVILTIFLSLLPVQAAVSAACDVPSAPYPTIQSAVDDPACALINLGTGTFHENIIIQRPVEISGQGAAHTVVSAITGGLTFAIKAAPVHLQDMSIENGYGSEGGGIRYEGAGLFITDCNIRKNTAGTKGGGIFSKGSVTIQGGIFSENNANEGGGIYVESGNMSITGTVISYNEAAEDGGGVFSQQYSEAALNNVSLKQNKARVDGGGIFNIGSMVIRDSAVNKNTAKSFSGGGIRNEGSLNIINSTVSSNKDNGVHGGGISNCPGSLRLKNVTLSANEGSPALYNCGGVVRIKNSIISGNPDKDCSGTIQSDGYNLVSNTSGCNFQSAPGDLLNTAAQLGPLAGSPAYHPLLFGPGINGGDPAGCTDHLGQPLLTDQRGAPRVGRCDMGAYEYQGQYHQSFLPLSIHKLCAPFFDDFRDPYSGWPVVDDSLVLAGYLDGEYQVLSKNANYLYLFESPACAWDDFVVAVDARWDSEPGLAYGLIFDIMGDYDQYYLFAVNSDYQVYWLDYRGPSGWETVVDFTENGAINSDQAANHLQVTREGNLITLEANGVVLSQIADGRIAGPGITGLFSAPYSDRAVSDARFDNFLSKELGQGGLSVPVAQPSGLAVQFPSDPFQELDLSP